jgi:hypothetical protein
MKATIAKLSSVAVVCMLSAGARADAPLSKKTGHGSPADNSVKWTLKVADKEYGMRPEGGSIPLPSELDWSCRYSQPRTKSHKGAEETAIHVNCTRSDSRFSFTPVCTRSLSKDKDKDKDSAGDSVQSNGSQSVTLYTGNQIVVVAVSCNETP